MILLALISVLTLVPQDGTDLDGLLHVKVRAGHAERFGEYADVLAQRKTLPAPRRADTVGIARIHTLDVVVGREAALAAALAEQPWVEWVDRPSTGHALIDVPPDDTHYDSQWSLEQTSDVDIDVELGWLARGTCGVDPDLLIGVIDTGAFVNTTNPDLVGLNIVKTGETIDGVDTDANGFVDDLWGWDFVDDDHTLDTGHPHGTAVASVIAAHTSNATGMAGIASGARLMHCRAFNDDGDWPEGGPYAGQASAAAAIVYLVDEGVDLINNSWTDLDGPTPLILDAIDYAIANDVHMIFGSANDDANDSTPANHPDVVAVGGIDSDGVKSTFANYGSWVDVSGGATGILILSTDDLFYSVNGTSFSGPACTAVAAHLLSEDADLSIADLRDILIDGGTDLDVLNPSYVGEMGTLLNLYNSVALMAPFAEITSSPAPVIGVFQPVLNAWGGTMTLDPMTLSLSKAPPAAQTAVVLGLSEANVPAVGGVLVPAPDIVRFFLTDANGEQRLRFTLPSSLGAGTEVWVQMLCSDAGAQGGWSFSTPIVITGE